MFLNSLLQLLLSFKSFFLLFQLDVNELADQGGVAFDITDGHDEKGETTNVRNGLKY